MQNNLTLEQALQRIEELEKEKEKLENKIGKMEDDIATIRNVLWDVQSAYVAAINIVDKY